MSPPYPFTSSPWLLWVSFIARSWTPHKAPTLWKWVREPKPIWPFVGETLDAFILAEQMQLHSFGHCGKSKRWYFVPKKRGFLNPPYSIELRRCKKRSTLLARVITHSSFSSWEVSHPRFASPDSYLPHHSAVPPKKVLDPPLVQKGMRVSAQGPLKLQKVEMKAAFTCSISDITCSTCSRLFPFVSLRPFHKGSEPHTNILLQNKILKKPVQLCCVGGGVSLLPLHLQLSLVSSVTC